MHILHALFSSRLAGSERYCVDLANRQVAAGHDVSVTGAPGSPLRNMLSRRVRYHPLGRFLRGPRLRGLIRTLRPDVCHGHLSGACRALASLPPHHVTVATLHVGYKPHQHARLGGVICVNHAQTKRLEGYPGLARVIPNWMPAAEAPRTGSGLRETLGLAANRFVVGAVGRLHPSKGMDILITAFRSCALDDARLVILGEGPQRRELEKLSAGDARIHLPGFRADVHSCLREIDLFVCPSREESFGLAIIEAMGAQRPVIATATEGPAEFMRDQPAVLVPPGSPAALADAIRTAYSQFQRGELAPANYDLTAFDPAPRIDSIIGFYHQVAAARVPSTVELAGKVSVTP